MLTAIEVGIFVALILGSGGFIVNNVLESRRGHGHPVLRWLRNLGLIVIWPLLVIRAFLI